jgi:NADPH:quinone reductase-like Zn-dependent oxidoreductase
MVKSLGPDEVIDYTQQDFTRAGETYDFVFDSVGKLSLGRCKPLLKSGGIYISTDLGPMAQNPFFALWTSRFGDKKLLFPIPKERKEDADLLARLAEDGTFKPVIDRTYTLDQVADAFRYVETRQKTGNVVVSVS